MHIMTVMYSYSSFVVLPILVGLFTRTTIGLWGHSGMGKPPMYGDYEAQRHWMEITISIPVGDWYRNTTNNDLLYWGLDYPPLTAYVSWGFGKLATYLVPSLVELKSSRGNESYSGKSFMRATVLLCDAVIFLPSLIFWILYLSNIYKNLSKNNSKTKIIYQNIIIYSSIFIPSILLIDHGHFQYNGVCIGLTLIGAICIHNEWNIIGSIFFCLSLNFKQMSLYYSPVFFFILLRKCFILKYPKNIIQFIMIGSTVICIFIILWFPFCLWHDISETCISSLFHVLSRQFPFSRGLFEDKVANLWYASSVLIDYKQLLPVPVLVRLSLVATLLFLSPMVVDMLRRPMSARRLLLCLNNSALAFFLASYQVHEKSLLLVLVPMSLLVQEDPLFVLWFQVLGTFTMFPLLVKDGLVVPYAVTIVLYLAIFALLRELEEMGCKAAGEASRRDREATKGSDVFEDTVSTTTARASFHGLSGNSNIQLLKKTFVALSVIGMVLLHGLHSMVTPPTRLPDLFPALFAIYGALNLLVAYIYCVIWQYFSS